LLAGLALQTAPWDRWATSQGEPLTMRTKARLTLFITLFIALGIGLAGPAFAAPPNSPAQYPSQRVASSHRSASALRPKFRPPRGAAAQDAARLGALVGKECRGKAGLPRNDHESVVLCSNGKTFVVATPVPHAAATPATECSLAGTGPQPPCFDQ
jgi:hypothetical protein